MHYLHAILVKADLEHYERLKDKPEDLAQYFQTIAFEETEKYGDGRTFRCLLQRHWYYTGGFS